MGRSDVTGKCIFHISSFSSNGADFYRFGAVLEEFEVRDALESVFYGKLEPFAKLEI